MHGKKECRQSQYELKLIFSPKWRESYQNQHIGKGETVVKDHGKKNKGVRGNEGDGIDSGINVMVSQFRQRM